MCRPGPRSEALAFSYVVAFCVDCFFYKKAKILPPVGVDAVGVVDVVGFVGSALVVVVALVVVIVNECGDGGVNVLVVVVCAIWRRPPSAANGPSICRDWRCPVW